VPIRGKSQFKSLSRCLSAIVLALCLGSHVSASDQPFGIGLDGRPIASLAGANTRIVVLIFAASDCPISNRYVPEIARLNKEFTGSNSHSSPVRFWWVFPNPDDTASVVSRHNREFDLREDTLLDPRQLLVARAHAGVTPEAAVFTVEGNDLREVYHGRIDDRYISLGQERPQATHHDLEIAIAAALAGKPVPAAAGPPVGCSIVFLPK
jgi:hypothetical protein